MASNLADTSISTLPKELLSRIFQFIDDQATLAHLTYMTKQFCRIALPELYSKPCLLGRGPLEGVKHILPFSWLMIKRPDLAAHVESFQLRGSISDEAKVVAIPAGMPSSRRLSLPRTFRHDPDFLPLEDYFGDTFENGKRMFLGIVHRSEGNAIVHSC